MSSPITEADLAEIEKRVTTCGACNGIGTAINCPDCLGDEVHTRCLEDPGPCAYCGGDGKSGDNEDGVALLAEVKHLRSERDSALRFQREAEDALSHAKAEITALERVSEERRSRAKDAELENERLRNELATAKAMLADIVAANDREDLTSLYAAIAKARAEVSNG